MEGHPWLANDTTIFNTPILMNSDKDYLRQLEQATPPDDAKDQKRLQLEMKLNYRQAVGELIYLMVTC